MKRTYVVLTVALLMVLAACSEPLPAPRGKDDFKRCTSDVECKLCPGSCAPTAEADWTACASGTRGSPCTFASFTGPYAAICDEGYCDKAIDCKSFCKDAESSDWIGDSGFHIICNSYSFTPPANPEQLIYRRCQGIEQCDCDVPKTEFRQPTVCQRDPEFCTGLEVDIESAYAMAMTALGSDWAYAATLTYKNGQWLWEVRSDCDSDGTRAYILTTIFNIDAESGAISWEPKHACMR